MPLATSSHASSWFVHLVTGLPSRGSVLAVNQKARSPGAPGPPRPSLPARPGPATEPPEDPVDGEPGNGDEPGEGIVSMPIFDPFRKAEKWW